MNIKNTLISFSLLTLPTLAFGQILDCNSVGTGFNESYIIRMKFDLDSPDINYMKVALMDQSEDHDQVTNITLKPEADGRCKMTVTNTDGGPLNIILNVPKNLQAKESFPGAIEHSGEHKISDAKKTLNCRLDEIPAALSECKESKMDSAEAKKDLIVISEKVKNCELETPDNCINKPDNLYCFVPIKCHVTKDDFELESSEYAFCQHKVFFQKGYKNDQERIQACIDDKGPLVKQKLTEFKETKTFHKLYQTPENNQ